LHGLRLILGTEGRVGLVISQHCSAFQCASLISTITRQRAAGPFRSTPFESEYEGNKFEQMNVLQSTETISKGSAITIREVFRPHAIEYAPARTEECASDIP